MEYLKEVKALRESLPVGIKLAEKLLIESNGDLAQAERNFKEAQVNAFLQKEALNAEQAARYLEAANYDIGIAIQKFNADKYSVTELCLQKHKNKEDALDKVFLAINEKYGYDFWLCWEKECPKIHGAEYDFVVLWGWINYESWEGVIVLSPAVAQASHNLNIRWLEDALNLAIGRSKDVEKIWEDEAYILLHESFSTRRHELIDILHRHVKANIGIFP